MAVEGMYEVVRPGLTAEISADESTMMVLRGVDDKGRAVELGLTRRQYSLMTLLWLTWDKAQGMLSKEDEDRLVTLTERVQGNGYGST